MWSCTCLPPPPAWAPGNDRNFRSPPVNRKFRYLTPGSGYFRLMIFLSDVTGSYIWFYRYRISILPALKSTRAQRTPQMSASVSGGFRLGGPRICPWRSCRSWELLLHIYRCVTTHSPPNSPIFYHTHPKIDNNFQNVSKESFSVSWRNKITK